MAWPFTTFDIGDGVEVSWGNDGILYWRHSAHGTCSRRSRSAWFWLYFRPHEKSTGHEIAAGGPTDMEHLTIHGSLLCPARCGFHGVIENGRWRSC